MATLHYIGMRRSELIRLTVDDIDFDNCRITIAAGKNGDARIVPLHNFAAVAIRRYLTRIRDTHRHRDLKALWLGRDGALRADSITKIFNRISNEAGLDQPLKSHQLRRLLAKTWVNFSSCTAAAGSVVLQGRVPSLLAVWKRILRFGRFQAASTISADVH